MVTEYRIVYLSPTEPMPSWLRSISVDHEDMLRDSYNAGEFGWYLFTPDYRDRTAGPFTSPTEAVKAIATLI